LQTDEQVQFSKLHCLNSLLRCNYCGRDVALHRWPAFTPSSRSCQQLFIHADRAQHAPAFIIGIFTLYQLLAQYFSGRCIHKVNVQLETCLFTALMSSFSSGRKITLCCLSLAPGFHPKYTVYESLKRMILCRV